jgi:hypothetical protein
MAKKKPKEYTMTTMGENRSAKRRSYAARGLGALPPVETGAAVRAATKKSSDLRCFFVAVRTRFIDFTYQSAIFQPFTEAVIGSGRK